jgi:hypothetical protein
LWQAQVGDDHMGLAREGLRDFQADAAHAPVTTATFPLS